MRIHNAIVGSSTPIDIPGQVGYCAMVYPSELLPFRESEFRNATQPAALLAFIFQTIDYAPTAVNTIRARLAREGYAEKSISMLAFDLETLSPNPVFNPFPPIIDPTLYATFLGALFNRLASAFQAVFPQAIVTVYADAIPTIWAMNGQHPSDKAAWDAAQAALACCRPDFPSVSVYLQQTAAYTYTAAEWGPSIDEYAARVRPKPKALWTRLVYGVSGNPVPTSEINALRDRAANAGFTDLVIWDTARNPTELARVQSQISLLTPVP